MDIFILDSYVIILFSDKCTSWGGIIGTQIMPRDLKNSSQDLSNEGSNFILSPLVVGQPEITCLASYNNLRIGQDSESAKF